MTTNFKKSGVAIREIRLGSITGYEGKAKDLVEKSQTGAIRERDRKFTQCGTCSSFCATLQLSLIRDTAVINHAPVGCAGDFSMFNLYMRYGLTKRGLKVSNANLVSTNLSEHDTVFGAVEKLYDSIIDTFRRFNPKAIFVTASCVSGIIGEDIESVIDQAEKEIGIPVVSVNCEGFRSQIWATGWDAAYGAILQKLVKPAKCKRSDLVNIITFIGDDYFSELLTPLGLKTKLIVPFQSVEDLETLSEAAATVQMCPTLGTYFAHGLEKVYGVPEIKVPPPYGISATDEWLREIGRVTGKESEAEQLIVSGRKEIESELAEFRKRFSGLKAFVAAGPAHGHSYMSVLQDLGFDLIGSCMFHHDPKLDHGSAAGETLQHVVKSYGDVSYGVCNKQSFELVNLILKLKPDVLVIRHPSLIVWGAKLGIPTFFVDDEHLALGYKGLLRYGEIIPDWLKNPSIERTLAEHTKLPYTKWWLEQKPFSFLGEVQ